MADWGQLIVLAFAIFIQTGGQIDRSKIEIVNTGTPIPYRMTEFEAGPVIGNMLNAHYFPGINFYNAGRYREAELEFTYVVLRSGYLSDNPRRAEYLSTTHFFRGMIFSYHARGVGRHSLAKADFEAAVKWNPRNHVAYLELSRIYSSLGFNGQAAAIIRHLLSLSPDEETAEEARKELSKITPGLH